jgi:hypothetical protein
MLDASCSEGLIEPLLKRLSGASAAGCFNFQNSLPQHFSTKKGVLPALAGRP